VYVTCNWHVRIRTWFFTTDNDVVLVSPDFSPAARRYTGGLRKTTQVPKLSSSGDL